MSAPDIKTFTIQGGAEVFGHSRRGRKAKGDGSTSRKRGGGAPSLADVQKEGGQTVQTVMTAGVLPLGMRTANIDGYQAPTMRGMGGMALQGAPTIQGEINPAQGIRGGGAMPIPAIAAGPVPAVLEVPRSVPPQHNLKVEQASFHFDNKDKINGGARKVELRKPAAHRKVLLNPKKYKTSSGTHSTPHKTRKSRKITLGLSTLHKRVTRAKKIREQVKEIPLADLRKELIKRGLIKESSKAPESILRQIAADAQIVAGKGL